jgi:hypothetical protein
MTKVRAAVVAVVIKVEADIGAEAAAAEAIAAAEVTTKVAEVVVTEVGEADTEHFLNLPLFYIFL